MNKILLLLADGFEDVEALGTCDLLLRSGQAVITATISDNLEVISSFKIKIKADTYLKNINADDFDVLVLPGGGLGVKNLGESKLVKSIVEDFIKKDKIVAAICAAPSILGKYGYLRDKRYTCYAGFNEGIDGHFTAEECVIDGKIVTARSMKYFAKFAYAILKVLDKDYLVGQVEKACEGKEHK